MKYRILSPDGFDINVECGFNSFNEAMHFYFDWVQRYKLQGYYSSVNGKIPISELNLHCKFIEGEKDNIKNQS